MGVEERKEREKQARREAIMASAQELFFAKGFNATTMDEIAQRTELSKGTLYLYFGSKEELYVTVMSKGLEILFAWVDEAFSLDLSPDEMIRKLGEVYYRYYLDYREYSRIFFFLEHGEVAKQLPRELIQGNLDKGLDRLDRFAGIIQQGIKEGIFNPVEPRKTAEVFRGAIQGVLFLFEDELNREIISTDSKQLLEYTIDLFIEALKKK
jgi:AcrR family transcriptional regulator